MSLLLPDTLHHLDVESNGALMTPEEFDAIEEYDRAYRYELVHGVVIVSPVPSLAEGTPNDEIGRLLLNYRYDHPQGSCVDETCPEFYVRLADGRRTADRVVWVGLGRPPDEKQDVPTIVIELVSKRARDRRRDYVEKREDYLDLGVREYWIIDRCRRIMTVCRPDQPDQEVPENQVYQSPLLPGFVLPLARILQIADRYQ